MALKGVQEFGADIAAMAEDPALADFVLPGAVLLVMDERAENLIWSSPAARPIRDSLLADGDGRLDRTSPAFSSLQAAVGRLAPNGPIRILKLPLDRAVGRPLQCACRLVQLPSGPALLVAVLGQRRKHEAEARGLGEDPTLPGPSSAEAGAGVATPPLGGPGGREPSAGRTAPERPGSIRFVWQADPQGRFARVSAGLDEAVGPDAADIVGRTWADIRDVLVEDPTGEIGERLASREAWSGVTVHWRRVGGSTVPVQLAGAATFSAEGRFTGFRGFGWVREVPPRAEPSEAAPAEPVGRQPSSSLLLPKPLSNSEADGSSEGGPVASAASHPHRLAGLTPAERAAFREIARALGARLADESPLVALPRTGDAVWDSAGDAPLGGAVPVEEMARLLDRLPIGILVHRGDEVLCANRALLDLAGYADAGELVSAGGAGSLFPSRAEDPEGSAAPVAIVDRNGARVPARVRIVTTPWRGAPAGVLIVGRAEEPDAGQRARALALELEQREVRLREQAAILDTATDGVVVLDGRGRILSLNRSAEALFGYDQNEVAGESFAVLFARETGEAALAYLESLRSGGVASLINDGRDILGRVRQGGLVPLSLSLGRIGEGPDSTFCAVLRDVTAVHKVEEELTAARQAAEAASARKSELLARISHEIRTPLNAIVGFAEIMLEERFGPVGNERYRDYLNDIRTSGTEVVEMVDELLALAQVEAGDTELSFTDLDLNDVVADCVGSLQPAAARERIVVRTSFAANLPRVVADERSVKQIASNVIVNALRRTEAGGQVIVSTAPTDAGEVAFRVRDTGTGMTRQEIDGALQPFRQGATRRRGGGSDLGLPLTRALVQANRGHLHIRSARYEGTLVEVLFPPTRVLTP